MGIWIFILIIFVSKFILYANVHCHQEHITGKHVFYNTSFILASSAFNKIAAILCEGPKWYAGE